MNGRARFVAQLLEHLISWLSFNPLVDDDLIEAEMSWWSTYCDIDE